LCIYDLFHILLSLWHTYGSMECVYICMYVCMYVSDFAMSIIIYPEDFVSMNAEQLFPETPFKVSIKIFICHVQVIMYWNVTGMREKRNEYRDFVGKTEWKRPQGRPSHRWEMIENWVLIKY
jgi:hypothetical protein